MLEYFMIATIFLVWVLDFIMHKTDNNVEYYSYSFTLAYTRYFKCAKGLSNIGDAF